MLRTTLFPHLAAATAQLAASTESASRRLCRSTCQRWLLAVMLVVTLAPAPVWSQLNLFGRRPDTAPATNVPANVKRVGTRLTGFGIPFSIDDPEQKFVEVQLYLSKNRGLTWQFYARQDLAAREIPFEASGDGEYWFCLKTLDRNRQLQPPGNATVELIVVVDTIMPEVDFRVQPDAAGRIVCRWKADDQNIDPSTVQLAYRPLLSENDSENVWVDVPYKAVEAAKNGTFADQYAFWADASARELVVRLRIADLGGNEVILERQLLSPRLSSNRPNVAAVSGNPRTQAAPASYQTQRPVLPPAALPMPQTRSGSSESSSPRAPFLPRSSAPQGPLPSDPSCPDGNCPPKKPGLLGNWNPWKKSEAPEPPPASLPASAFPAPPASVAAAPATQLASSAAPPPSQLPAAVQNGNTSPDSGLTPTSDSSRQQPIHPAVGPVSSNLHQLPPPPSGSLYGAVASNGLSPAPTNTPSPNSGERPGSSVGWPSRSLAPSGQTISQGTALPFNLNESPKLSIGLGSTVDLPAAVQPAAANETPPEGDSVGSPRPTNIVQASPPTPQPLLPPQDAPQIPNREQPLATSPGTATWQDSKSLNALPASTALPAATGFGQPEEAAGNSVLAPAAAAPLPIAPPLHNAAALNLQAVGSQRFRLNYENTYLEPTLIKSVVLWMTTDGGQTWTSYGEDPDGVSPFPVQVEREGTYGFRVVYETTDGVMGRAPARGDQPDMWVRVDITPPTAQLVSAPFGRGPDAGALLINWRAEDLDLGEHPITLSWSPTAEGPWTSIVTGHPNTGSYAWRLGNQAPDRVFLQLEVMDAAGNRTVSTTTRPIELNGLAPRGRILSVDPVK